ncbi:MAG: hypothetical protein R2792_18060, partial [Saprospiraceae bacterium]
MSKIQQAILRAYLRRNARQIDAVCRKRHPSNLLNPNPSPPRSLMRYFMNDPKLIFMRLRILSLLLFLLCSAFPLAAQFVPQGFNYQGIVRDDNGNPLANQSVSILFAIRSGAPNGPVSYSETQLTNTNEYGLVNVTIGQGGTPVQGTFNGINWGGSAKYLSIA